MVGQAKEDLKLIQTKNKLQLNNLWLRQIVMDIFVAKWLQLVETGRNSNTKYFYKKTFHGTVSFLTKMIDFWTKVCKLNHCEGQAY